ncbi:uncharacterized protein LOC110710203 [Chenopodium quinoa]|uniref:uncharacterized protein LOC110710203 n=1 Tax=Chenopodium quinoa TaxID=63459 RepID=UPI000B78F8B1|nr:uncharacterized protein LOC110710203 [Chenopodium quinoa]
MDPNNNDPKPMDGPEHSNPWAPPVPPTDDDDDHALWSMLDSWVNDPVPLQDMPFVQSNDHHQNVGFDGGDEGRDVSVQGMQQGVGTEDMTPQDQQQLQQQDQLPLQVVWPNHDPCASCQVLREITFTNDFVLQGTHTTKLVIHGNVGFIYHALYYSNYGLPPSDDHIGNHQFIDFSMRSFEETREYLKGYIAHQRQNGYILLREPISSFYEALSVGFDWLNFEGKQRERLKNMTLEDFAKYFDRTINDASVELHLCATVIKKKLRSFEIDRWPYRKVKSLQGKLTNLIERTGGEYNRLIKMEPERVETEIQKLQQRISDILSGRLKP